MSVYILGYLFQLEIRCRMMESRYQDEMLKVRQQHDSDVKKVWCNVASLADEVFFSYFVYFFSLYTQVLFCLLSDIIAYSHCTVFLFFILHILLYHCEHGGLDLMGLKPDP